MTTTTATPVSISPIESLGVYLGLVSIITLKCKNISSSDLTNTEACNALTDAVTKYRAMLSPLNAILPSVPDLEGLDTTRLLQYGHPIMEPDRYKELLKTLQRESSLYKESLKGDEIYSSYFSSENRDRRDKIVDTGNISPNWGDMVELLMSIAGQERLTRQELNGAATQTKTLLIVSLFPQILVLTCIIMQYTLLKKRELAAKRRTQQIARDRRLLDQLMERRRGDQQIEMV